MTGPSRNEVRRSSIRVALAATGLVALVYVGVAAAFVAITVSDLTAQVDRRLEMILREGNRPPDGGGDDPFEPPDEDRPFGPVLLTWTINADGTVIAEPGTPELPAEYRDTTDPQTVTIDGTELRIAGADMGAGHVVVGQTLDQVVQARSTLILATLVIGPLLLLVVFVGAVVIGRRVAAPIEEARRRQLEFTADASHELRTPLAVIEANTSLALAQDRSADWYRGAFVKVDREAGRMRRLVEDLLWLARFDATTAPPSSEPVDLGVVAEGAADRFGAVAEARHVALGVTLASGGLVVAAPPEWLDRLLGVLLDNACKYAPDGGRVDVTVRAEGGRVRLTVDDDGPGIPEAERGQVFDRFHRAAGGTPGAGLGLAIGDAIVRAIGGRWQVGTSPTGGARMTVSLPQADAASRSA